MFVIKQKCQVLNYNLQDPSILYNLNEIDCNLIVKFIIKLIVNKNT